MPIVPPTSPIRLTLIPGLPLADDLNIFQRATPQGDAATLDLTGYSPVNVGIVLRTRDQDVIAAPPVANLTLTATLGDPGVIRLRATGAATLAALQGVSQRGAVGDLLVTDPDGHTSIWCNFECSIQRTCSTPPAESNPVYDPVVHNLVLESTPASSGEVTTGEVSVNLKTAATTVIYTATTNGEIVKSATIRVTAASGVTGFATVQFTRSDGTIYHAPLALTGLDAVGEARLIGFFGTIPTLSVGQSIRATVTVPATGTTLTAGVAVEVQRV